MHREALLPAFDFSAHVVSPWAEGAEITGWVVGMGVFVNVACALLGCFLILRGKALLGDAISHALLAGLAGAFLLSGSRGPVVMVIGAIVAGVVTVALIELIHRTTRVKEDASIAVVFSAMFALGVVLITRYTEGVDLDAGCVLYGEIEYSYLRTENVKFMGVIAAIVAGGIALFYKELQITSFDAPTAMALGIPAAAIHYGLMTAVSITVVAGMEAVGAILVVTMLIAPGAAAYLVTDNLRRMLLIAAGFGALSAAMGFHVALWLDCSTAGAMSLVATAIFVGAFLASPRHGVVMRAVRRAQLAARIARENLLRTAFQLAPTPQAALAGGLPVEAVAEQLRVLPGDLERTCRRLARRGWLRRGDENRICLTQEGFAQARRIVRAHRLWETFLVDQMGLAEDHVHPDAEQIEHMLSEKLLDRVDDLLGHPITDPHGKRIPRVAEWLQTGARTSLSRLREGDRAILTGLDPSASDTVAGRVAGLDLPLGVEVEIGARTPDGQWRITLPDGTGRGIDHELADAIRMEVRRAEQGRWVG